MPRSMPITIKADDRRFRIMWALAYAIVTHSGTSTDLVLYEEHPSVALRHICAECERNDP